jgi:hypothetical protein
MVVAIPHKQGRSSLEQHEQHLVGAECYVFLKRDTCDVTGTIGLHYADFSAGLAATVATSGGTGTK